MWFFLGLLVICLTVIAVFRMYLDLREGDRRHVRIVQSDAQSYDKYKRITQQEALAELTKLIDRRAMDNISLPPAQFIQEGSSPTLDAEINRRLERDYYNFIRRQRQREQPWD